MKRTGKSLALILALLMVCALLAGCGSESTETPSPAAQEPTQAPVVSETELSDGSDAASLAELLSYDAESMPDGYKNVVFVSGSWYDMGYQFAMQVPDAVKRNVTSGISANVAEYGWDAIRELAADCIAYYEEKIPETVQLWHGMADALGLDFETFAIGMVEIPATGVTTADDVTRNEEGCSSIAAWGDTTENGQLIVGSDWDSIGSDCYYMPAVVAYPENGNAFVTQSGWRGNLVLNEKGLVCTGSSGQSAGEGDNAMGIPVMTATYILAARCDTAQEAADEYLNAGLTSIYSENQSYHDINGGHIVIEASAAHHDTRFPGDFQDDNYQITSNDFMTEEMLSSLLPAGSGYDDCRPRYWTEERILLDAEGQATAHTIAEALGADRYYMDGEWIENDWSLDYGLHSPEAFSPFYQNVAKSVAIPENGSYFVMNGCRNTNVSLLPNASGSFVQLILSATPEETAANARFTSNSLIFDAAKYVDETENKEALQEYLNLAKEAQIAGDNYTAQAGIAETELDALMLCSRAASQYLKAQSFAQRAMEDAAAVLYY